MPGRAFVQLTQLLITFAASLLGARIAVADGPRPDPATVYAIRIEGAPYKGPAAAKVTIVEAFEFACPFSEKVRATITELMKDYGNDVRVVYKHFVVHPHVATDPALAACAAHQQGKFQEMEHLLWEKAYKASRNFGRDNLESIAKEAGLDISKYKADLDGACKQIILKDQAELVAAGNRGTPAFYINGRFLSGAQPIERFKALIDEELKKADAAIAGGVTLENYYHFAVVQGGTVSQPVVAQVNWVGRWNRAIVDSPVGGSSVMCQNEHYLLSPGGKARFRASCIDMGNTDEEEFKVDTPLLWQQDGTSLVLSIDKHNKKVCEWLPKRPALRAPAVKGCKYFVESPDSILLWTIESHPIRPELARLVRSKDDGALGAAGGAGSVVGGSVQVASLECQSQDGSKKWFSYDEPIAIREQEEVMGAPARCGAMLTANADIEVRTSLEVHALDESGGLRRAFKTRPTRARLRAGVGAVVTAAIPDKAWDLEADAFRIVYVVLGSGARTPPLARVERMYDVEHSGPAREEDE